ncbi:MAG TPA: sigma-70 family RNA polymerase sigma factor [Dehalococcoidia bacterium]|nr:sigma-70 family RNA polymerase sigma factor [Dehalococcoidia bacterium]
MDDAGPRDDELMDGIARRDLRAFETLHGRYGDLVYSVALRVVGDPHVAEDVTQDVFLRVWRRPDHFDLRRGKFVTWLLSVTRNRSIDERRSQARRLRHSVLPPTTEEEDILPSADERDDPALASVLAEERRAVRDALDLLPPEQKLAIQLAYFGGLTQQEIATRLGQPLGTVKTRIRLGMRKMRAALERREGSGGR